MYYNINKHMVHIIYKTTNKHSGKYYIGVHSTNNINDSYLGSGEALKNAIKKYGRESFTKEILHICETREEAFIIEKQLVDPSDLMSYNLIAGGTTGGTFGKVRSISEETKRKISETLKGYVQSEESILKRAESNRGQKRSEETKQHMSDIQLGRKMTDEAKQNMSSAAKKRTKQAWTGKKRPTKECPHCNKVGADYLMTRWHFDKCKSK
jgi:group I intron endonuclease